MKKILISMSLTLLLALSTGCSSKEPREPAVAQSVTMESGVVESVRKVPMGNNGVGNTIGSVVGSVGGSIAGSHVGSGTGRVVASVLGAVLGSVVGAAAGDELDTNYAQEVVVKLSSGKTVVTILEDKSASDFLSAGQVVKVSFAGDKIMDIVAE